MSAIDLKILNSIGEWAAYKSYGDILTSTVNQIITIKSIINDDEIDLDPKLKSRLKFFSILSEINKLSDVENNTIEKYELILTLFDDIHQKFHRDLYLKGILARNWLHFRNKIIKLIATRILIQSIDYNIQSNKIIKSFDDFDYSNYCKVIEGLYKKYEFKFNDAKDIDVESFASIQYSEFLDIIDKDSYKNIISKGSNRRPSRFKDTAITNLIKSDSVNEFREEIDKYFRSAEQLILPSPELIAILSKSSDRNNSMSLSPQPSISNSNDIYTHKSKDNHNSIDRVLIQKDWSDKKAKTSGPYRDVSASKTKASVETRDNQSKSTLSSTLKEFNHKNKVNDPLLSIDRSIKASKQLTLTPKKRVIDDKPITRSPRLAKQRKLSSFIDDEDEIDEFLPNQKIKDIKKSISPVKSKKKSLIDSRPSATRLNAQDSDFDNFEEDEEEVVIIKSHNSRNKDVEEIDEDEDFQPPEHVKSKAIETLQNIPKVVHKQFPKKLEDSKGNQSVDDTSVSYYPPIRNKWTFEEVQALIDGVKRYGFGKWKEIKEDGEFGPELERRTNVNLKDKYRTLINQGAV